MTKFTKCDNCGVLQLDPYRLGTDEEREEARRVRERQVLITLEHDDNALCFDACSWACVADLALKQAAESAANTEERKS